MLDIDRVWIVSTCPLPCPPWEMVNNNYRIHTCLWTVRGWGHHFIKAVHTCVDIGHRNEVCPTVQPPSASSVLHGVQRFLSDGYPARRGIVTRYSVTAQLAPWTQKGHRILGVPAFLFPRNLCPCGNVTGYFYSYGLCYSRDVELKRGASKSRRDISISLGITQKRQHAYSKR